MVLHWFPCQLVYFPCKYLSVPLSIYKLKRQDLMPLMESVVDRLSTWKSRFMSRAGHTTLTKVTLSPFLSMSPLPSKCHRGSTMRLTSFTGPLYGRERIRHEVANARSRGHW
jgi:hypothetical protein